MVFSVSRLRLISLVLLTLLLQACATATPTNRQNICALFEEKSGWYKDAKKAADKWQSTVPIIMSIMYQESAYVAKARPPRTKILWIFPGPRPSDAYGYPQAKDNTWDWYQENTGHYSARRYDFADAADFIAWYNWQSNQLAGAPLNDSFSLYLAYHEGQGGYKRGTYKGKQWLLNIAKTVASRTANFDAQLKNCLAQLESKRGWF
ncbi:MAG TPA: transglycosylase SLT domain-containing protein [Cellvibrionaceae bacterium]